MKKISLILLCSLIVVQLAVPFSMIKGREKILIHGELFKFRTRPVDPADPFQGRYVRLAFEDDYIPDLQKPVPSLHYGQTVFAQIEEGSDGFARFTTWSLKEPEQGTYLKTKYQGIHQNYITETEEWKKNGLRIDMPFNRFYMEEEKAPRAEILARDSTRNTNCWAGVRILKGKAAIEDVYADGQSLSDLAAGEQD